MDKTKFFNKVKQVNCEHDYYSEIIYSSLSFSECRKYVGYAKGWNDGGILNNNNKKISVDYLFLSNYHDKVVPCTVTVHCVNKITVQ